jgi:hypothetical protein
LGANHSFDASSSLNETGCYDQQDDHAVWVLPQIFRIQ